MRAPCRRERGVTLIELLVAITVSAIVLAAILGVVQSQQASYYQGHLQRGAQGSARAAMEFIEQRVSLAGYGMDASLAFDFDRYTAAPCPSVAAPCVRDSVNGNDELVFYARNPNYWVPDVSTGEPRGNAWRILSLGSGSVSVSARAGDEFVKGRILQAVCKSATKYAYFTVNETIAVTDDGTATIQLASSVTSNPFKRQDTALPSVDGCFTNGEARVFLIDRYRFHVRPVSAVGGYQPYLVLDTGLDANGDGPDEGEEIIVAEGIESFQVGYVMTNTALTPRGTVPGTAIVFTQGASGATTGNGMTTLLFPGTVDPGLSEYRPTSWYGYAAGPPAPTARLTDHQANIRAVRIAIVARGPQPEPTGAGAPVEIPLLNQNAAPSWFGTSPYARSRVDTTVLVRNMVSRGMNDF